MAQILMEHKPILNHEPAPADAGSSMVSAHLNYVSLDSLRQSESFLDRKTMHMPEKHLPAKR